MDKGDSVGLRFDPIGGGQFKQAVQSIIEAESIPLKGLQKKKANEEARLKLFNEFKGKFAGLEKALSEMTSFRQFRELKADLGDGSDVASVTIDKDKAEPGQYNVEVSDLAARTSAMTNGFSTPDDNILGMGFVSIKAENGSSVEVYVDDQNSSLRGIATAINRNPDSPVRAAVIKDASDSDVPWKLLLTSKKDGAQSQVETPEFYFEDTDEEIYVDADHDAKNAEIVVDGIEIEAESNDIPDFFPGVNLHLKQARPDRAFTLTISEDNQKISGKIKGLVDNVNQILDFIVKQNSVDEHTDTSTTFAGDGSLQTLEYKLRNVIHEGLPSSEGDTPPLFLNQIGVEFDKAGQLTFKEDKFKAAVDKNFDQIAFAITGSQGFAGKIRAVIDSYTHLGTGTLSVKGKGIRDRITQIDDQIDQKNRYIDKRRQDLVAQYSRLEATLGNLQRQQQYLSASLPGGGGGGNLVSQLLGG